jgi:hypothetical protein
MMTKMARKEGRGRREEEERGGGRREEKAGGERRSCTWHILV